MSTRRRSVGALPAGGFGPLADVSADTDRSDPLGLGEVRR
jgi:hypothetical protein